MATALFINRTDLVKNSIIDGNVDTNKFIQFIKIAQEIHIRNYTGSKLYDKLQADIIAGTLTGNYQTLVDEYLAPMLIHFAMVEYLPYSAYQLKNGGLFKHTSENAETPSKDEVDFLVQKERNLAEYYTTRFIDHMSFNNNLYPEYEQNSDDDIYPDKDSLFNGWVL
jgi:hypothetical protein